MLNKLTGEELMSLTRAAQMISHLSDQLVKEGITDVYVTTRLVSAATPALIERAFNGS